MISTDCERTIKRIMTALSVAAVSACGLSPVQAQLLRKGSTPQAPAQAKAKPSNPTPAPTPTFKPTRVPVNPNDPIALVNGEPITRQQLADECVARKGEEILETLIARKLIDQAIRKQKLTVTRAEIDAEINRVADQIAHTNRERWLATLNSERGISPEQYARDIIEPSLALRKLAAPLVQVTPEDMKQAFESQFGEKLRCRLIMLPTLDMAKQAWEEVKRKPELFEKVAQEKSIDQGTRGVGGLLAAPIARHSHPQNVSDAAFEQLVDGDKSLPKPGPNATAQEKDLYAKYTPKDGDISGIIQASEYTWVILKRESVVPAVEYDANDKLLAQRMHEAVYETKLQEKISELMDGLMRAAAIENKLNGQIKLANEEEQPEYQAAIQEGKPLMSNPNAAIPPKPGSGATETAGKATLAPPPGVSDADVKRAEALKQKLKSDDK